MRRLFSISGLLAALACGSVKDKQACSASTDCPVGQYCAHAGGESRCWADAQAPVVQTTTASCSPAPCLRDGRLHVEATIADDAEVLDASIALDLPGGAPVQMTRSGASWVADVDLRPFGFPAFARDVVATVTARDGARNASAPRSAAGVAVSRLRWERVLETGTVVTPTVPAVKPDGTVVVGGSNGKVYFIAVDGTDAQPALPVGAGPITAAPAIGANTIWVGSEDGTLYGVAADGSAVRAGVGVNVGGVVSGGVAVLPGAGKEWAFVQSSAGFVGVASSAVGEDAVNGPTMAFSTGPVLGTDGRLFSATATGALRAYTITTSPVLALADAWNVSVGVEVAAPVAVGATNEIWTAAVEKLSSTAPGDTNGTVSPRATLPARISDSPVLLSNGDVVVGDQSGILHRLTSAGASVWATPNLGAAVQAPAVLASGDASLLVPTAGGKLYALRDDGAEIWSSTLDPGRSLLAPNLHTPAGQAANVMSTAYVASSSGKLFAVIVDGQLDASAPWPKAFHDPRNTNRAGPQP